MLGHFLREVNKLKTKGVDGVFPTSCTGTLKDDRKSLILVYSHP